MKKTVHNFCLDESKNIEDEQERKLSVLLPSTP
jgi:hypothetical protein